MEFPTASATKRPVRLPARVRKWAWESMQGKYGEEAMQTPYVTITKEGFEKLTDYEKYDYMIDLIVNKAPIRVCEEELVSGAATLGYAVKHIIPAFYNGNAVYSSVSHLTLDFHTTLTKGVDSYEAIILKQLQDASFDESQKIFFKSLLNVISAMRIYHKRYLKATKSTKPVVYQNLLQVPFKPARNFHEAVQSIWFVFAFTRLCGNWPGIGRLDWLLGDYLKRDLETGVLTKKQAREILASFFIKGTEWIERDTPQTSGDAQHYQNIVLAGVDENGQEITNEVTYLVLDIVEELGISDFPITVRLNDKTPKKLLTKVAKVMRHGGGVVAVYNEPLILEALTNYGYDLKEARHFANDGCWEVQVPGKTFFQYHAFDSLAILQLETLQSYQNRSFDSFEDLYQAYVKSLYTAVEQIYEDKRKQFLYRTESGSWDWLEYPTSVISLFENGCIEKGRSYFNGGPVYRVISPHIGGLADTVNSLYAIKKLVFDEKKITFSKFMEILQKDWEGCDDLKAHVASYAYYGTDNDEVDELYRKLIDEFYKACKKLDDKSKFFFPAGSSTFGREIDWLPHRLATSSGAKKGAILAGNASPTPGTDTEGATAVIKSYCKADLKKLVTGTALDIKISPAALSGDNGVVALIALMKGFLSLGGYFMQLDTVSAETLKKARENPKQYKTLSVRVSGWNARFITLSKEWQDMVIQRTEHNG